MLRRFGRFTGAWQVAWRTQLCRWPSNAASGRFEPGAPPRARAGFCVSIMCSRKGSARSTRRFMKRLNEEMGVPLIVFTDCDPWSFRIFASVAYGAIKTAHISEYLATPTAVYLGITATDILNYDLPTDKLSGQDVKALESELTDPRFKDRFWRDEIELMLKIKKKAEQQALAKYGLDFATDTYLPEKLSQLGLLK